MINFLRASLKSFIFSAAKKKEVYKLKDIPHEWEKMSDSDSLWKKVIDDEDTSVKAVYFHALEDEEDLLHYHDYVEHIIVLKGKVRIETEKQSFNLTSGDDLTIPAKVPHYSEAKKGSIQLVIWHPVTEPELVWSKL